MKEFRKSIIIIVILVTSGLYSANPPISEHRRERGHIRLENFNSYSPERRNDEPEKNRQNRQRRADYKLSWEYYRTEGRDWRTYGERRPLPEARQHRTQDRRNFQVRQSASNDNRQEQIRLRKERERTIRLIIARQQRSEKIKQRNFRLLQLRREQRENVVTVAARVKPRRPERRVTNIREQQAEVETEPTPDRTSGRQPVNRNMNHAKGKVRILHLNLSDFYFRSGTPLTLTAYITNELPSPSYLEVKVSLYVHKRGLASAVPIRSISGILQTGMITPYKFSFIWDEAGYNSNYNYQHGDYKFEVVVEYGNVKINEIRVLYTRPINYTFFWQKPPKK